jgi:hypothetical protein
MECRPSAKMMPCGTIYQIESHKNLAFEISLPFTKRLIHSIA